MRLSSLFLAVAVAACGTSERDSSIKSRVIPKSGEVWANDLARGLGLDTWELCTELGEYDCVSDAHLITLGGVEPQTLGIDVPLPNALVSAPIAVDRVAVSACGERLKRDKKGPAIVFGPILDKDSRGKRKDVAGALVERLLTRVATKDELDALEDLYAELEPLSKDPIDDWAVGACVIVATSTEALFY